MSSTNGKAGPYRSVAASQAALDPMAKILETGNRVPGELMIVGAIVLHVLVGGGAMYAAAFDEIYAWQRGIKDVIAYQVDQENIDLIKDPPPPPPEPEKPPEPEPERAPPPKDTPPPEAAPPKPAEAGKVLVADSKPDEPVDLTGGFVQGSGDNYAGGSTSSDGTSKKPVYNPAAASTGVPGGTGTAPAPPPPRKNDQSRVPGLLGSSDWNDCPFPGEADAEQIDRQAVLIQVVVKPDGSPDNVIVVQDPGHGFGREARKCAMRKKYAPGMDADGKPVGGTTKPFRVRFER